jgi:competence CoiA-like predicted nuclease
MNMDYLSWKGIIVLKLLNRCRAQNRAQNHFNQLQVVVFHVAPGFTMWRLISEADLTWRRILHLSLFLKLKGSRMYVQCFSTDHIIPDAEYTVVSQR